MSDKRRLVIHKKSAPQKKTGQVRRKNIVVEQKSITRPPQGTVKAYVGKSESQIRPPTLLERIKTAWRKATTGPMARW